MKSHSKDQILEAAIAEFLKKGYDGASMESIAKRAKLSKGGLYHHFKSKSEILLAATVRFAEPLESIINETRGSESVSEGLRNYIKNYIEYWLSNPDKFSFYLLMTVKALSDKEVAKLFRQYNEYMMSFFSSLIKKGIDKNELADCDVIARAGSILSSLDGAVAYILFDPQMDSSKIIEDFQNVFISSITK